MEKLLKIQTELKAPKGRKNTFGNYKYRSCEDILESVKPLLQKYNCTLMLNDSLVNIGDRYYVKATAQLKDNDNDECTSTATVSAYAREAESKKGMDESQITGTASSYARKYALNGLFLIDDTKDADTDEYKNETKNKSKHDTEEAEYEKKESEEMNKIISKAQQKTIEDLLVATNSDRQKFIAYMGKDVSVFNGYDFAKAVKSFEKKKGK
jgi:methionyl-tRNA formyltransferase